MFVPSAQADDSATRVASPSVKRRGKEAVTEAIVAPNLAR
jgi:hypothetical protein